MYPMKSKGEANEALSLMFQHEGVLPSMVMDGSKWQTLGKFYWKLDNSHCQMKPTEPYSPWQKAAERDIKELKKGLRCKMLAIGALRCPWGDCLEPEAYIHSHRVNSIPGLDGEFPKTDMSGKQ